MKKILSLATVILLFHITALGQNDAPKLLLRLDDNGMNHSVTKAIEQVAAAGISFSTSVMFACPWYQEAVDVLKKYPQVSVGVHLVLNSEWKYYRWGPVVGRTAVPSLVDSNGYFLSSSDSFLKSKYKLAEVEKELTAQIERAMHSGLKIDYLDHHMGTAASTPQLRAIVEKLAKRYHLGISRYFGENYETMFDVSVSAKKDEFMKKMASLPKDKWNLMVMHVAQATPEMNALVDMNNEDQHSDTEPIVAMHRSAELNVLLSSEFSELVKSNKIRLATYKDVIRQENLAKMKAPNSGD
jgi:predicted glycoside hydrolase/deacetylase ChbG (UPF0249 family)